MRKGLVFLMAVSVCLALATPVMADRTDRTADRSKAAERGVISDDDRTTIHPVVRRVPLMFRSHEGEIGMNADAQAEHYLAAAARAENNNDAIANLWQAVEFTSNEKMLAEAYKQLAALYEGAAHKQVHCLSLAMQYTSEPAVRAHLQRQITELGGDVISASLSNRGATNTSRDFGPDDYCDTAPAIGALPWWEVMALEDWDENYRTFDVPDGPEGWYMRIETIATPASVWDDTVLYLYSDCVGGSGSNIIGYNDDKWYDDYYFSRIDTDCLFPGTYYIKVRGYAYYPVADFILEVEKTGTCILPEPDGYEDDNDRADATEIGLPTSIPGHANGWGRAHKEIQDHSIFPPYDIDHVSFGVQRSEMVSMTIAQSFPTFFNDFLDVPAGYDVDSYIELLYGVEADYGGFCNDPVNGFNPYCRSDDDCPPPVGPQIPDFPDCIPIYFFNFGGYIYWWPENPLAWNDDAWGSIGYGSQLVQCLPRSDNNTPSLSANGDWILRMMASPTYAWGDTFEYQVQVKNEVQCRFEVEPNNGPFGANWLDLGNEVVHGFQDLSEFLGTGQNNYQGAYWFSTDPDWWEFDVDEPSKFTFETDGHHIYWCDTTIVMYVGPDDDGWYYSLYDAGAWDDDSGPGYLSYLEVIAPSADVLLGTEVADANYFLDVTTFWPVPNFEYTLYTTVIPYTPPAMETEPNNDCGVANDVAVGGTIMGDVYPACDFDAYAFTLDEDTYVVLETDTGDTTMLLSGAGGELGCDDDGGVGLTSKIEGCLPAGSYCAEVRAYSSYGTINDYTLSVADMGACAPTDPPTVIADELYRCDDVQEPDEFHQCPNVLGD